MTQTPSNYPPDYDSQIDDPRPEVEEGDCEPLELEYE